MNVLDYHRNGLLLLVSGDSYGSSDNAGSELIVEREHTVQLEHWNLQTHLQSVVSLLFAILGEESGNSIQNLSTVFFLLKYMSFTRDQMHTDSPQLEHGLVAAAGRTSDSCSHLTLASDTFDLVGQTLAHSK